ncbi:hypothetical protein XAC3716 [Xanthomonas citri pv. citri str. 306]|uniref:Uncharacterized protein n=1 Tax=Xanthomonas axonopodis pv. citri (strain 306) TaxID=190486 RepID=A0AAI7ZI67_XANAC|nr:hypothetical protein XAC3716 [Xanthomonas citri pv. citri str. 306]CEE39337.1 conserved hypothetical protein [Xanthomonas citri pv. citri]CEE76066.1 conserved hypothetical protein [Xanthomonas citri pv. citri]CEE80437.1 conserved hypothetical protein [Xanthomonas citri pv. citri]CEH75158.1 conserved hypothetical protein [Xanthomonas citri pv. citri]
MLWPSRAFEAQVKSCGGASMFERLELNHANRACELIGQALGQEHSFLQRLVRAMRRCEHEIRCRAISHAQVVNEILDAVGIDADHTDIVDAVSDPVGNQSCQPWPLAVQ